MLASKSLQKAYSYPYADILLPIKMCWAWLGWRFLSGSPCGAVPWICDKHSASGALILLRLSLIPPLSTQRGGGGVHRVGRGHSKDSWPQVMRVIPDHKMSRSAIKTGGKRRKAGGMFGAVVCVFPSATQ